ncbi:MAG: hypothetical protein ABIZ80_13895 [Bryobacteraceae bacterium]
MHCLPVRIAMALCVCCAAYGIEEPQDLLHRFLERMKAELERLPDYACSQTIDRFLRSSSELPWQPAGTLRFEVAMVGNRELFARQGARRFEERPLAELAGRGTTSTGQHGLLAKHVFFLPATHFSFRGEGERKGRRAHEYTYEVPLENSTYKLRSGPAEAVSAFQGSFWFDVESLDLIHLEAQAFDMPPSLGLAEVHTALSYSRINIESASALLPLSAALTVVALDGAESLNRTELSACRRYGAESVVLFDREAAALTTPEAPQPAPTPAIPPGTHLELALDANLDPRTVKPGDPVSAHLTRPVKDGDRILIAQGAAVLRGHIVRLERQEMPFPLYEVGIEFDTLALGGREIPISLTMEEAGPAPGLVRQAKRLDPTFTRRRAARMDVLVREVQRGMGILLWDAKRTPIPSRLRMRWRVSRPRRAAERHRQTAEGEPASCPS